MPLPRWSGANGPVPQGRQQGEGIGLGQPLPVAVAAQLPGPFLTLVREFRSDRPVVGKQRQPQRLDQVNEFGAALADGRLAFLIRDPCDHA
ncbi:hypothetical protein AB0D04_38640 [Streptomyces sp. NPDC048483]|uniref:hypothetical protein n=1 Tax=Streptomyces sp. NPDC048483 TaxID=3154927 RepID=UPI003437C045